MSGTDPPFGIQGKNPVLLDLGIPMEAQVIVITFMRTTCEFYDEIRGRK